MIKVLGGAAAATLLIVLAGAAIMLWRPAETGVMMQCRADYKFYSLAQETPYRQLTISLAMMKDHQGYFDLYGYVQRGGTPEGGAAKLSRRLYFTWQAVGVNYLLKMTRQDRYNRDSATDELLPEFLGSKSLVIYINALAKGRFLIGDLASPFGVCS